ncbi:hypothetical protein M407DRAFT_32574 [Tulasnella calospora MUT 4182]|uniref:F-box domain-containing protein n=1 Tax=Tulasnella calospora MUT 4182 TaxID=1051891 RepID=A0A0C3L8A4_9AGAM|nr:hypothetical protein M407DRAFT_32574 [Tulasnella calospora MUT 4182]
MQYYSSGWKWKGDWYDYSAELSAALSSFDGRLGDDIKAICFGGTRFREDLIILGPIFQRHFPNVEELVVTLDSSERRPDAHLVLEAENGATLGTPVVKRRSHNELHHPIHRLPPELLYIIIENVYTEVSYELLFALRSVCKHWMEIVDSMPHLWARIALHHNANLISSCLQKSKTQPLDVRCKEGENYVVRDSPPFQERAADFLRHIGPSAARWRSLDYLAPTNAQHERILSLPLHNLETLCVSISGAAVDYTGVFDTPRLQNLDTRKLSLNWRSLSNLRSLQIDGCVPSPTVDEVYILLKSSPNLELFKIARNRSSPTGHTTDLSDFHSSPILLPKLRTLHIVQVPFISHSRLLDLVEAPNLHRFVVFQHFPYHSYDFTPMFESAGRLIGAPRYSRGDGDTSRLSIFGAYDMLAVVVGDCRVILKNHGWAQIISQEERPAGLSAVLRHFNARSCESIRVIRLFGFRSDQEMIDLAHTLNRHLPNVEELEMKMCISTSALEGLSILGPLSSSPTEGKEACLFPSLVSFQFDVPKGLACDGILEVLKARWNVGQVQAIRQLTIEGGKIRHDTVDVLKAHLEALKMTGTEVS